ncbi:MAG: protein-L-isoaspartate O-methyltransferase [Burkholderiaceae bacterium]
MNTEKARFNMIEQQIRPWQVLDTDVLDLLMVVKREAFVPPAYRSMAFVDTEIPLASGETMLQPKFEARILQEMRVKKHEQVLEIGSGSGYMAALLAYKARNVTTVEILPELAAMARRNLAAFGVDHVQVDEGDGACGWPSPGSGDQNYDVIVVSGSLPVPPQALIQQLSLGGRMFVVVGEAPSMSAQLITRMSEVDFNTIQLFETVIRPLRNTLTPSHFIF